jgi:bifunctional non-homologous end joining protein LigD
MAALQPLPLGQVRAPFDDPGWIFELKLDGFRALAHLRDGKAELVSRRGLVYRSRIFTALAAQIPGDIREQTAVLDGELVVLDAHGRPQFSELMHRRGVPVFVAFDVLLLDGKDVRDLPLLERKRALRRAVRRSARAVQLVDHVRGTGIDLYALACALDLEGIVAKRADSLYRVEIPPVWLKIKNRDYSQGVGRFELFQRHHRP